ncbi:SIR2 family protein [Flammeovirga kamogawensis]|uniref:hypothetical protein n=1 Tax=Flammeovirga kamogawensis TaxID=373891 RepID=UPI001184577B|nr:hypothetical protein [Flammeovirga kamogawensis]MBB6459692.1 hypothetical protein [Flammeovirga kamogawensis]TRX69066.1 hypothetical protein EO216_13370 [Flammeovirga kamogawensis]
MINSNTPSKREILTASAIQEIIEQHKSQLCFVFGNGINRYFSKENITWDKLLIELWNKYSKKAKFENQIFKGISFTEFYDAIDIQNTTKKNFSATIQKDVKNTMSLWKHNDEQNIILNKICALNAPILTTNFDDLIPKSAQLKPFKIPYKGFTDYYPWNCYFSNKKLNNPIDGFGVWYLNGMIKYHRSIKLGLSQYMGNVERVRKMMYKNRGVIGKEDKLAKKWNGYPTWLHIIFNKSLCIIGLGLEENEVFFRWLLIERAKYFKAFPSQKKDGWYITVKKEDDSFLGKKFFLESVGIKVLEVDNYETIYKHIWQ